MADLEFYQRLADEWKLRLGLSHWDFTVTFWTKKQADDEGAYGQLDPCYDKRVARINLLNPDDVDDESDSLTTYDPEWTIVHELLHIYTAQILGQVPAKRQWAQNVKAEQMAHFVSVALVDLRRKAQRGPDTDH